MADQQKSKSNPPQNLPSSSSSNSRVSGEIGHNGSTLYSGQKPHYPNPPDRTNPDAATLREQWKFAIRQYSKWYAHAWGTAILAGGAFFVLGWIIKGSNPLPSFQKQNDKSSLPPPPPPPPHHDDDDKAAGVNQAR